jgi:hypothetical protein
MKNRRKSWGSGVSRNFKGTARFFGKLLGNVRRNSLGCCISMETLV